MMKMGNVDAVKHIYGRIAPDIVWIEAENIPYWQHGPTVGHDTILRTIFEQMEKDFGHIRDFDGDKVVHFQQYSDTSQWRRVLGVDA